jgi:hypothetical protein
MLYELINYNTLYKNIKLDIEEFCKKFEISFEDSKVKTKRELLIYFSLIEILNKLEKRKLEKPIIIFDSNFDNALFRFCFKQISKILVIPVYFVENEISNGTKKELASKADSFYDLNIFTVKKLKKQLFFLKHNTLVENICGFKSLGYSQRMEHTFEL